MKDSELLTYIKKLIEQKSDTLQGNTAWQEHLDRHTVVSAKSLQASEIISGFSGSWASIYSSLPSEVRKEKIASQRTPPNPSKEYYKLGQSGVPEINFHPYNHHTSRKGVDGGSLIGHPISFSVVGPTVKSKAYDWQFVADDNSNNPTQGDTLFIDYESSVLNPMGANPPIANNLSNAFGFSPSMTAVPEYGLYLVISHTGEDPPTIGLNKAGLGDGFIANKGVIPTFPNYPFPRKPVVAKNFGSKYEIFRIVGIEPDSVGGKITLDPSKRLKDYFNFDNDSTNIIRSITIIRPEATKLFSVPYSNSGHERAFVVVPPSSSLQGDILPPFQGSNAEDGTWKTGGFDPVNPSLYGINPTSGPTIGYSDTCQLPIPRVLSTETGFLERVSDDFETQAGFPLASQISRIINANLHSIPNGSIIEIFKKETDSDKDIPLSNNPIGYFEKLANYAASWDNSLSGIYVKSVAKVDVRTGVKNFRPIIVDDTTDPNHAGMTYAVTFNVYDPVRDLFTKYRNDLDAVAHCRLDNLIDPTWVKESGKQQEYGQETLFSKSDRAIFNTQSTSGGASGTNADPGSLLDLGFRMVLFPAKVVGNSILPDFDKPITSREANIDPTLSESQSIHIDYSSGLVLLSHEPKYEDDKGNLIENDINPNGVIDPITNRIVLFASCVPYSREEGQLGPAVRVTASTVDVQYDHEEQEDIYGQRIAFDIKGSVGGSPQTINSQIFNDQLVLSSLDEDHQLPDSGYIEILHSISTPNLSNHPAFTVMDAEGIERRVSTFIYHSKTTITEGGIDYTALVAVVGGGETADSISTTGVDGEYKIVLRKNVRPKADSQGVCGVPYQEDTTHGSSKRFGTLRFRNSNIIQNKDGSVTIDVGSLTTDSDFETNTIPLEGEFVLVPKGPTSANGFGEVRWFENTQSQPYLYNITDYPSDLPLYEFSGGYGKGFFKKGYSIKPGTHFAFQSIYPTPPSEVSTMDEVFGRVANSDLRSFQYIGNSSLCSGNLSVAYRHSNSRESWLYADSPRQFQINQIPFRQQHSKSMKQQMRLLDGMVIENVTNGTFYTVGSIGLKTASGAVGNPRLEIASAPILDGDTVYISYSAVSKTEFVFREIPDPSNPLEVLIGNTTTASMENLVLVANSHPDASTLNKKFTLDIEYGFVKNYLHLYSSDTPTIVGPTVTIAQGIDVYNDPNNFVGYYGIGGSIVGDSNSSTPLIEKDYRQALLANTHTDNMLKANLIFQQEDHNYIVTSGDRASLFYILYDPTKTANLQLKEELVIAYFDIHGNVYELPIAIVPGADLKTSLNQLILIINGKTAADYTAAGFPQTEDRFVEAKLVHIEEGVNHNRYVIEFRFEKTGGEGNRWAIKRTQPNIGGIGGITSLVTPTLSEGELNHNGTTWTTYAALNGGTFYQTTTLFNGDEYWFLTGGYESEINYDVSEHFDYKRLPNQSGFGDRTDSNNPRNPLAGHEYRIVPNVEFVPVMGAKGVSGGLIPPYFDALDSSTVILNAHALFYDERYDFTGEDVGRKLYICGTDRYAYVGWWEILGILSDYTLPNLGGAKATVAIVNKIGIETRSENNDRRIYNQQILTDRGQLPLTWRSPIVRMGFDFNTNGQGGFSGKISETRGFFDHWDGSNPSEATYSDLAITIRLNENGTANKVQQFVISKQDLAEGRLFQQSPDTNYVVTDAVGLAKFCNSDGRANGSSFIFSDGSTGVSFIKWIVESNLEYPSGTALYATFHLGILSPVQKQSLIGADTLFQLNFLSRQDKSFFKDDPTYGPPVGLNDPTAIGFISYSGHNAEFDNCIGDRNSLSSTKVYEVIDAASNPFGQPSLTNKEVKSASRGLRWVISSPLTDRHNGSYCHMVKESSHIYTGINWHHEPSIGLGTEPVIFTYKDIYRLNKCPATKQFLVGGDCEVYTNTSTGYMDLEVDKSQSVFGKPMAYSTVGVMGVWKDSDTGVLPVTTGSNYSPTYQLQLMNKERIVNVSPTNMLGISLFGSQTRTDKVGTGGLASRVINYNNPQMVLSAETPFKLFSKANVQRTNIWGGDASNATSLGEDLDNRSERELWNTDNFYGRDLSIIKQSIPFMYYSLYNWTPNSAWWQLQLPTLQENDQVDGSTPPPTLRIDLTEQFTQSLVLGNGNNLEGGESKAKGVRLNKIWINFGIWPDAYDTIMGGKGKIPGIPYPSMDINSVLLKPQTPRNQNTIQSHMAFNLILELPSHQKKRHNFSSRRNVIYVGNTVSPSDIGGVLFTTTITGQPQTSWVACSTNDNTGAVVAIPDYGVVVGKYVLDTNTQQWNWSPFSPSKVARSITSCINYAYNNSNLSPSGASLKATAVAVYDNVIIQFEWDAVKTVIEVVNTQALAQNFYIDDDRSNLFNNSGTENLLFGNRSTTSTSNYALTTNQQDLFQTIVIPLYVNRGGGDLMPNTMEQNVDVGMGKQSFGSGVNLPKDWSVGDAEYGFGFSDFPHYYIINNQTWADTITETPYQMHVTPTHWWSKNLLIGNPTSPVVWGGQDFDSAVNNGVQPNNDYPDWNSAMTLNAIGVETDKFVAWGGRFTAPFAGSIQSTVLASMHPRLSRLSGGVRDNYAVGGAINGGDYNRQSNSYPYEGPVALSSSAQTGIVVSHKAMFPRMTASREGSEILSTTSNNLGNNDPRERNARTCSHSFTIALTPMGQKFEYPTDTRGVRASAGTNQGEPVNVNVTDPQRVTEFGRSLIPSNNKNLVGNWLSEIMEHLGVEGDGSTLPQGARVYLEVSTNLGNVDGGTSNNGVWVGSVKCSFDVETEYGTTKTEINEE